MAPEAAPRPRLRPLLACLAGAATLTLAGFGFAGVGGAGRGRVALAGRAAHPHAPSRAPEGGGGMEGGGGGAEGGGGTQVKRRDEASGLEFWLYTPAGHDASAAARWPLLLFLHGAGESGRDLDDLISTGATGCPPVELAHGRAAPSLAANFVVASPQTDRSRVGRRRQARQAYQLAARGRGAGAGPGAAVRDRGVDGGRGLLDRRDHRAVRRHRARLRRRLRARAPPALSTANTRPTPPPLD